MMSIISNAARAASCITAGLFSGYFVSYEPSRRDFEIDFRPCKRIAAIFLGASLFSAITIVSWKEINKSAAWSIVIGTLAGYYAAEQIDHQSHESAKNKNLRDRYIIGYLAGLMAGISTTALITTRLEKLFGRK